MSDLFQLNATQNHYVMPKGMGSALWDSLKNGWKTALFMEAMRNLNWSRDYNWYCLLDGVPAPFHRRGVLGLPATSFNYILAGGEVKSWESSGTPLSVPLKNLSNATTISLDLLDDEQGTLRQFFERWFNEVYNPAYGVLPLDESVKCLTLYYQKSTRRNVKRVYFDIDEKIEDNGTLFSKVHNITKGRLSHVLAKDTEGIDFLVFPRGQLNLQHQTDNNGLIHFNVQLEVADISNRDYGNPNFHHGVSTVFDMSDGKINNGNSWLDKIADYI